MKNNKESRYTEAQARAVRKYLTETVEDVRIRVPKGQKAVIKAHADVMGESMNAFVVRAIDETMDRDREHTSAAAEHHQSNQQDNSPDIVNSKALDVETLENKQELPEEMPHVLNESSDKIKEDNSVRAQVNRQIQITVKPQVLHESSDECKGKHSSVREQINRQIEIIDRQQAEKAAKAKAEPKRIPQYACSKEIELAKAQLLDQFNQLESKEELKAQWQQNKK